MRNPERIPNILRNIEVIWEKYPDLRLGQLLINAVGEEMLYYTEDTQIIRKLQDCYNKKDIPDFGWWD